MHTPAERVATCSLPRFSFDLPTRHPAREYPDRTGIPGSTCEIPNGVAPEGDERTVVGHRNLICEIRKVGEKNDLNFIFMSGARKLSLQ